MQLTGGTFSGHESFPFRNTWLTKGVVHCDEDPALFSSPEAMVILGVGKNMVHSIRHWCLATQMLEEDNGSKPSRGRLFRPTSIARRLFLEDGGWDRYLEDVGTLWLIHWLLATNWERATTIYYAYNEHNAVEIGRRELQQAMATVASSIPGVRASEDTIRRDVDIFLRTYVGTKAASDKALEDSLDCPLAELGLLHETPDGRFSFARGPKETLPESVLIYALDQYAGWHVGQRSFRFEDLAYKPRGPGRVFKLDEGALAERLERLADTTAGAWQFSETAGLKQLVLTRPIDTKRLLQHYYRGRMDAVCGVAL